MKMKNKRVIDNRFFLFFPSSFNENKFILLIFLPSKKFAS